MADLEARSQKDPAKSWRRPLPDGPVVLSRGQLPADQLPPGAVCWPVDWDGFVSTPHAFLTWQNGRLSVRRRVTPRPTTNPIYVNEIESDEFTVGPQQSFRIGSTLFTVRAEAEAPGQDTLDRGDVAELSCTPEQLREVRYSDAGLRIEALAGLPELIRLSPTDDQLEEQVARVLLVGMPNAAAAAVVRLTSDPSSAEVGLAVATAVHAASSPGEFRPSRRLVREAVRRRQSVLHVWHNPGQGGDDPTMTAGTDWAVCAPLLDDLNPGWALYVAGRLTRALASPGHVHDDAELKGDLKFAELAADVFASLRSVRALQRRLGVLSRFLSPKVVAAAADQNVEDLLRPRRRVVTVLFCDLRGSCRIMEDGVDDLERLSETVSEALAIMTGAIVENDGVIADLQGDAALGFWGWPFEQPDQVGRACRAALLIRKRFGQAAQAPRHRLAGLSCGIGVAHGPAIVGRIGTPDQFKVDVFGPVVNLAARLEGLTKHVRAPVLVDEPVAAAVSGGDLARCRRVARVLPAGMSRALTVSELLPPAHEPGVLSEAQRLTYEAGLDAFQAGIWPDALGKLKYLLPLNDGPALFLKDFLDRHAEGPPAGWDGVVAMHAK